jgi:integrase
MCYLGAEYLLQRDGIFYYNRRIPDDVSAQYTSKRVVFSLKTRSRSAAVRSAASVTGQLEKQWLHFRTEQWPIPVLTNKTSHSTGTSLCGATLSDALDVYVRLKGGEKGTKFIHHATRSANYTIEAIGNLDLTSYDGKSKGVLRDSLLERGLASSSAKRIFASVRAMVNFIICEHGLKVANPFLNVFFPELNDTIKRKPFSTKDIRLLHDKCRSTDDDVRHLAALISDTGMRLSEATGLKVSDIKVDGPTPYVHIRPNPIRRLKTKQSERQVPLVGASLWAAKRVLANSIGDYAFPRYIKNGTCLANSASATLNKWIRSNISNDLVVHSMRHGFCDRLREVGCPPEVKDSLGGWSRNSIGESYGDGYSLKAKHKWLSKIILQ